MEISFSDFFALPGVVEVRGPNNGPDLRIREAVRIVDPGMDDGTNVRHDERHAKAYAAGKLAHQQGYAAGSNPHAATIDTLQALGWMAGWMDGMNEAINAVTVPHVPGRRAIRVS